MWGMMKAKYLIYDVENMAALGWHWGLYDQTIIRVQKPQHLLCLAYKWLGEKKVHTMAIWDYELYKTDPHSDLELAKDFHKVLSEADVVIGHNSDQFDNKMVHAMFMRHKLPPPAPYKQVDTKKMAKKHGRFLSNKVDDLGEEFGIGKKLQHEGFQLWLDCDNGVKKAHKKMLAYNKQDVILTEKLYLELRPWEKNPPKRGVLEGRPLACDACGSQTLHNHTKKTLAGQGWRMQYKCYDCGHYQIGTKMHKFEEKLD